MKYLFEVKVSYRPEMADKECTKVYLFESMSYTECEANVGVYMREYEGVEECRIKSMSPKSFANIFGDGVFGDKGGWMIGKLLLTPDLGKGYKEDYLVFAESVEQGNAIIMNNTEDTAEEYVREVTEIKKVDIAEIILSKECCEVCVTCENRFKMVTFEEQYSIEDKVGALRDFLREGNDYIVEIGGYDITRKKFKIKANKENLVKNKGRELSSRVVRTWCEDFIDEDTAEVVSIDRHEVLYEANTLMVDEVIEVILDNQIKEVSFWK